MVNKLWQRLSEQHNVKFKNFVYLREQQAIISEMSWCYVFQRAGSNYCVSNFTGTFVDFCFKKFTQEIICSYVDPCL